MCILQGIGYLGNERGCFERGIGVFLDMLGQRLPFDQLADQEHGHIIGRGTS